MKTRIEIKDNISSDEAVIYCREITPEIEKLARLLQKDNKSFDDISFLKDDQEFFFDLSEVLFFETENQVVYAHTKSDSFKTKNKLYELEKILPLYFTRISKSTIVNTVHIYSIQEV